MHTVRIGLAGAGMESGIINVTNRLPEDFRVSLCALAPEETFSKFITRPGAQFFTIPSRKASGVDWTLVSRLAKLFRQAKVDILHSHNWGSFLYSVLAAQLTGTTIIHGEHGKNFFELTERNRAKDWAKRLLGRRLHRLVTVSNDLRREWIERFHIPEEKTVWIPNGVDVNRFCPSPEDRVAARRHFGLPEAALIVGSVGKLEPIKNYLMMLDAAKAVLGKNERVVVALLGDGVSRKDTERHIAKLGIADRVHLLGWRFESPRFLHTLDIFVLPSVSEGMSNAVLEALASGLPIICPALPSHREVITPGLDGILMENFTTDTLAEMLLKLLAHDEDRRRLAQQARQTACNKFAIERMVERYERLYRDVDRTAGGVGH